MEPSVPAPIDRPDLDARLAACGFGPVQWFESIGSTNTWLAERARAGAPAGLVAIADEQTAGRGRLGRTWIAPPGSGLLMSVLIRPSMPVDRWPLVALAMGVAAMDAAVSAGAEEARLKWPNDLIMATRGDRKLAGILAELVMISGAQPDSGAVVVGIGTNVRRPPEVDPDVADRAIWLDEAGAYSSVDDLAVAIITGFAERIRQLEGDPFALLADYRARCATLGRDVRVELPGTVLLGTAVDIDASGRLVVREHATGKEAPVSAGDVVHVR